jgi:exonuclease III
MEDMAICCLQETHIIDRNKHLLRVKGWKRIYQTNGPGKQAEIAILISYEVDFNLTLVRRDKEGHFVLIKVTIHQKKITITNLYAPNVSVPQLHQTYIRGFKSTYKLQHNGSGRL